MKEKNDTETRLKKKWRSWRSPFVERLSRKRNYARRSEFISEIEDSTSAVDVVRFKEQQDFIDALPSVCAPVIACRLPGKEETCLPKHAPQSQVSGVTEHAAVKRERRFRNVMRARGGRARTSEEMHGSASRDQKLDTCSLAIASTDEDLKAVGAWNAWCFNSDEGAVKLRNVFAPSPGQMLYFQNKRRTGAVPPSLGTMNPYGGEGPERKGNIDAAQRAATTPPLLGSMNPYGGEGPPRARQAQVSQWWESYRELEAWVATNGFPSRNASHGDEKRLAKRWSNRSRNREKLDEEQRAALDRMEATANATPVDVDADWECSCSDLEAWVKNAGRLPKRNATDPAEKKQALWLKNQRQRKSKLNTVQCERLEAIEHVYALAEKRGIHASLEARDGSSQRSQRGRKVISGTVRASRLSFTLLRILKLARTMCTAL